MKKEHIPFVLVFLFCVLLRVLSVVPIAEDLESAYYFQMVSGSFTLSTNYLHAPLYVWLVKLFAIGLSPVLAFALWGAIAQFMVLVGILRLANFSLISFQGLLLSLLVIFNPHLSIMANRFDPTLLGVGLSMLILSLSLRGTSIHRKSLGFYLAGILAWIQPLFLLFALPSLIYVLLTEGQVKRMLLLFVGTTFGLLLLLFLFSGDEQGFPFMRGALALPAEGNLWLQKSGYLFKMLLTSGAGAWWMGRPLWQIIPAVAVLVPSIYFLLQKTFFNSSIKEYIVLVSVILFAGVVFLFVPLEGMREMITVLVPLFLLISVLGMLMLLPPFGGRAPYFLLLAALLLYAFNTVQLTQAHQQGSAAVQLARSIVDLPSNATVVVPDQVLEMYLRTVLSAPDAVRLSDQFNGKESIDSAYVVGFKVVNQELLQKLHLTPYQVFSHEPYLFISWSPLVLYKVY